jgi:16S rRNA (uracil1498-N3)-methyltransferase
VTVPFFFLADAADRAVDDVVRLVGDEGRHAARVRRLRVGEAVALTAGHGTVLRGVVTDVAADGLSVEVRDRIDVPRPQPRLTVVQALARGGRDERAVELMTELGVDEVVGWEAARGVARWTERTGARWAGVARSAAKQSRRAWWPQVGGPVPTAEVAALCSEAGLAVVLHEAATEPLTARLEPGVSDVVVVVGPEGGLTDEELTDLGAVGGHVVRLGRTVLRSSTAGAAAAAVVFAATRWA